MRKRKLKISIIPHGSENVKVTRMFIVLIPILIIILFFLSVYLITITIVNIKNIKDYKSIKTLREETAILTIKDRESKRTIKEIEKQINELKSTTKNITPIYEYLSGIISTSSEDSDIPSDIDSILILMKMMRTSYDSINSLIKESNTPQIIPSLVPVNGWVLREYGNIVDPYTETKRFSPGILFVAETNENVYATADGYIVFSGEKKKLGKTIIINHGNKYTTTYGHLGKILAYSGKSVKKGDIIGKVGKTGKTLSSSLYYEIKLRESTVNPEYSFLIPVYMLYDTLKTNL